MRARAKWIVTLLAPTIGLVVAEVMVRALGWSPLPPPRFDGSLLRPHPDPRIRFVNRPGAKQRNTYVYEKGASPVEVVARVNAEGFRGDVVGEPRRDGVWRVACLGDSQTFGYGVTDEEAWPSALRVALEQALGPGRAEVLNCGVFAYDTEQEEALLEERILCYRPDVVLLQFYLNDVAVRGVEEEDPAQIDWLVRLCHPWGGPKAMRFLRKNLRVADLVAWRIYTARYLASFERQHASRFGDDGAGWQTCRAAFERARDVLAREGIQFAVVLYPSLWSRDGHLASHDAYAVVQRACDERAIECWDVEAAFEQRDLARLRVHPLDMHPNAEAQRIFADALASRMLATGWFEEPPPGLASGKVSEGGRRSRNGR